MIGRRQILSQLHGVPIAVKDLCWTEGIATAAGCRCTATSCRASMPPSSASCARPVRCCSASSSSPKARSPTTIPTIARAAQSLARDHWSGASSSGSGVATAAGLCFGSLGSDTGGSIRFPSAANGNTGLKPTWGRVSRFGCFELAASLDHIGPMCRSATDAAIMLGAIAGSDPRDPTALRADVPDYLAADDRACCAACASASTSAMRSTTSTPRSRRAVEATLATVRSLGAEIVALRFPDVARWLADWGPHCAVETAVAHARPFPRSATDYGPGLAGAHRRRARDDRRPTISGSCCAGATSPAACTAALTPVDAMLSRRSRSPRRRSRAWRRSARCRPSSRR